MFKAMHKSWVYMIRIFKNFKGDVSVLSKAPVGKKINKHNTNYGTQDHL